MSEDFKSWLDKMCRIQSSVWESDWPLAVKLRAHHLIVRVASSVIRSGATK